MYYLSDGLRDRGPFLAALGKVLAVMFAILCIGGSLARRQQLPGQPVQGRPRRGGPLPEGQRLGLWRGHDPRSVAPSSSAACGASRDVASKIVPAMCGLYVAACLFVILLATPTRWSAPSGRSSRARSTPRQVLGGIVGVLIVGFKRAAFSNEAGVGSAAIAHSAAKSHYAVREGIVALLEPLIDTVIVCTMTALVIVITGAYVAVDPVTGTETVFNEYIAGGNGAGLTSMAFSTVIPWFKYVLAVAVVLFAFSTMISWSYYGERCFSWLFGDGYSIVYKVLFLSFSFLGSVITATAVLDFGDLMILGMAIPNVLGVFLLSGKVKVKLDEYMELKRSGQM